MQQLNCRSNTHYKGRMMPSIPFPQSYWVVPQLLCAGHYPGDRNADVRREKLTGLVQCRIERTINLIPEGETGRNGESFLPYHDELQALARERGGAVDCVRMGFPDGGIPSIDQMRAILDMIDTSLKARKPVYVHCWGGHGRTSTVIGCHLVRHGLAPSVAMERILAWRTNLPRNWFPFQNEQQAFLEAWKAEQ